MSLNQKIEITKAIDKALLELECSLGLMGSSADMQKVAEEYRNQLLKELCKGV